ncbi:MAG: hypothetical protein IKZ09_00170, partial [Clostridia bacterium]|nr:hypothetical protein [Clostridia bacterium]
MGILNFLLKSAAIDAAATVAMSAIDTAGKIAEKNTILGSPKAGIVRIPHSSSYYVGKKCIDVQNELLAYGFTNVVCFPIQDLINGWFTK